MTMSDAFDDLPTSRTLLVTVQSHDEFYQQGLDILRRLEAGETVDEPDTFSVPDVETLFKTFTPQTMQLLETISEADPASIRETARLVDRDIKNVHEEVSELERLGVIKLEQDGRTKRPIFSYDEIVISLPFDVDTSRDTAEA